MEDSIFHWEWSSGDIFHFYIETFGYPELAAYVKDQQQLDWIRGLVAPELAAVHREVFDWAAAHGTSLGSLGWREFEELIAAAFAAQGMSTTLGPGRSDGGIDLRLVRHEVFGDVMTAVQIKSGQTPVRLHYVQALAAASVADGNAESTSSLLRATCRAPGSGPRHGRRRPGIASISQRRPMSRSGASPPATGRGCPITD